MNKNTVRIFGSVAAVALVFIMGACKGGKSTGVAGLSGSTGSLCLSDAYTYTVELEGAKPSSYELNPDPLAQAYEGSIGGQIRGVASMNIALPGEEPNEVLFWGNGASVRYGTPDVQAGSVILKKPGAVTDLAPILYDGKQMLVYGTERGVGLVGSDASGSLEDKSKQGAWRSVPAGVLSLTSNDDGSRVVFTSADGYLQQISAKAITEGQNCSGIISSPVYSETAGADMVPTKAKLAGDNAFVLWKLANSVMTTAPTFDQAYDPIFNAMAEDTVLSTVTAIDLASGKARDVAFAANNGSFDSYDRFIPTDVASDGTNFYVVGLAYTQASVGEFIAANCAGASDVVECLREAARDGKLADYTGGSGIDRFVAGFFVYRDMTDLSKADHFEVIHISLYKSDENAPPFQYAIAVLGDQVFVRGPNFMVAKIRSGSESESWTFTAVADPTNVGLTTGLPNRIAPYGGGAVSSFTAVRQPDGSGASELEYMDMANMTFKVIDTGAIFIRVDGAGETSGLVAAIEMASGRGGKLYLENAVTRKPIDITFDGAFVSHAAYDGTRLAFSWSSTGNTANPESSQPWRISVQSGSSASTRGEVSISRSGGSAGEFKNFPAVSQQSEDPSMLRGIGSLMLSDDVKLAVLFSGYASNKWYHQMALYTLSKTGDNYDPPALIGISDTLTSAGTSASHAGKILRIQKIGSDHEIIFSNAEKIYSWKVTGNQSSPPAGTLTSIFEIPKFVDATVDAKNKSKVAIVSGDKIIIKDLANPSAAGLSFDVAKKEGSTLSRLIDARLGMSGNILALASPYGAAATFSLYNVDASSISLAAETSLTKFFDVKVFSFFPNYLLASSQASGVEIFNVGQ
ncbi:MAG: hypothetical protein ABH871_01840 [Pseudomonadota bacterium]